MAVLYVSTSKLKRDTPLGSSVDDNLIHPQITIAQDRWILPVLGTQLYEKLNTLITDATITQANNSNYKKLLDDYITPALVQFAFIEVAYALRVRFSNNTIVTPDSEWFRQVWRTSSWCSIVLRTLLCSIVSNSSTSCVSTLRTTPEYRKAEDDDIRASSRNYFQNLNVYERRVPDNQTRAFLSAIEYKG